MTIERHTDSALESFRYSLEVIIKNDQAWLLVDSMFGIGYNGTNLGGFPRISFICDDRIGITRERVEGKIRQKPPRVKIAHLLLTLLRKENVSIATNPRHKICVSQNDEREAIVEVKSHKPITLVQIPNDTEVFEILEKKLAEEIGPEQTYLSDRFTSL